jgi:hypothetical protein
MASGSASDLRQDAFDAWSAALGVFLRTASEGLEISVGGADGGADFLLLESPEPLPFTEDVALTLRRADSAPVDVPLAILSDGAERRSLLVPLDAAGAPTPLEPGRYEIAWRLHRRRYRAASGDAEARFVQEALSAFSLGDAP